MNITPLLMANLSNQAYQDNYKFQGFKSIFLSNNGSQAYFLYSKTAIIIVCRGTQPSHLEDIIADIRFKLVPSSSGIGKVHHGFKLSVDNIWDDLVYLLNKYKKNRLVYLTGHSLGAAMATLIAGRCHRFPDLPNPILYTFGSPRVGNTTYINYLNSLNIEHHRYINNCDVITRNPIFPYKHHGKIYYFDHNGNLTNFNVVQRTKDIIKGTIVGLKKGKINFFLNHFMENYIKNLEKLS
jgi:hypothetical protein